jgi:hypothetical protein
MFSGRTEAAEEKGNMKKLTALALISVFAVSTIHAKDKPKTGEMQCRELRDANYTVGPDETLVDGKVCKKVLMMPATWMVPDVSVPQEPGLYAVLSGGALRQIAGRPTSFVRTGSLLASELTMGMHARRVNTQIAGASAYVTVGRRATFYYRVAQSAPDQVVPGTVSLILTQMSVKQGRRQFELDAEGMFRRSQGISVRHQANFDAQELEPGLFKLNPDDLPEGQYAFFLYVAGPGQGGDWEWTRERATSSRRAGGEALRGFLYDFQVE